MRALVKGLAVLLPVFMLWGCTTTGEGVDTGAAAGGDITTGAPTTGAESDVQVGDVTGRGEFAGDPLTDPSNILSQRTVYFDFDRADIKTEAREVIEAHAKYLSENPNLRIVLEGHCDERGTREYNLGLGERRAKSVQQMMLLLGVSPAQLELVSYGEERPAAMAHNEDAWALNRRVEFVY